MTLKTRHFPLLMVNLKTSSTMLPRYCFLRIAHKGNALYCSVLILQVSNRCVLSLSPLSLSLSLSLSIDRPNVRSPNASGLCDVYFLNTPLWDPIRSTYTLKCYISPPILNSLCVTNICQKKKTTHAPPPKKNHKSALKLWTNRRRLHAPFIWQIYNL